MKPNQKQVQICAIISAQAEFWAMSNDIMSPTHSSDICNTLNDLVTNEEILQCEADDLEVKFIELLACVRSM